jgi:parvulin-like peptidyl-prolyl isomerase
LLLFAWPLPAAEAPPRRAASPAPLFADEIVAKGKGFELRRSELDDTVAAFRATLATQNQSFPDSERGAIAQRMLDRMVLTRILLQRATTEDKTKAKETADKFVADTKARSRSEEAYRRQLRATGITPALFESRALEQATVETVINRELRSTLTVSDDQVRDFYERGLDAEAREVQAVIDKLSVKETNTVFYSDAKQKLEGIVKANLARLERREQVRAQVIVLYLVDRLTRQELTASDQQAKHAVAQKVLTRLKAGEDWSKLAREFSDDPESARTGGEYTIIRDSPSVPELAELKASLFDMPINEITGLITNRLGYYMVKVIERTAAGKMPFDKAANDIRELLLGVETQKRLPEYSARLRKEYEVEIHFAP